MIHKISRYDEIIALTYNTRIKENPSIHVSKMNLKLCQIQISFMRVKIFNLLSVRVKVAERLVIFYAALKVWITEA